MKKLLLVLILTVFAVGMNLKAQPVPNGTFESWSSMPYSDPNGFTTGNLRDLQRIGAATVTKVTGYSGFGLRIQTIVSGTDTSDSYIINTDNPCSDPPQWTGGVPYSQKPTAITGYYRYNLPGSDSALMIVIFRKNGVHIGDNYITFRGTGNQSTWASFSFSVTCTGVPDSLIFAAAPSNKMTNAGVQNGSFLELDNLGFAGTTQAFPNGTFENWTAKNYDNASGWVSWGDGVSRSTSSYSGTYAVRMETMGSMCGGINSSGISTGSMTPSNGPAGGRPYTGTRDTLCGYYKYTPVGGDSAGIYISLTKNGSPVGGNNRWLLSAASYTYFEIPFQSGTAPDTMRIDAQSSEWPVTFSNVGSVLYLDNLYLKSNGLGILENENNIFNSFSYPIPVKEVLTVEFEKSIGGFANLFVFDATGRKVEVSGVIRNSSSMKIDVSNLTQGIYFYEVRVGGGSMRNKFVKE